MNVLELFAGSRSVGKAADELGYSSYSTDIQDFPGIDQVCSLLDFDPGKVPFVPDIIWASPPCTTYSIAAIRHHQRKLPNGRFEPRSEKARSSAKLIERTAELIAHFLKQNPDLIWYMENPRATLRKHQDLNYLGNLGWFTRHTVTYCQYGDNRQKPTDIWTNNRTWQPKPPCVQGDPCHVYTPRGQTRRKMKAQGIEIPLTGTGALKNNYERSKIPHALCLEALSSIEPITLTINEGLFK